MSSLIVFLVKKKECQVREETIRLFGILENYVRISKKELYSSNHKHGWHQGSRSASVHIGFLCTDMIGIRVTIEGCTFGFSKGGDHQLFFSRANGGGLWELYLLLQELYEKVKKEMGFGV